MELELRQKNQGLIAMLLQRQAAINRISKSRDVLRREIDCVQSGLDRLLLRKGDRSPKHSDTTALAGDENVNNNNAEISRQSPVQNIFCSVQFPESPQLKSRSELSSNDKSICSLSMLDSPRACENGDVSLSGDVVVQRNSPEEKKEVRRKLADEMSESVLGGDSTQCEKLESTCLNESVSKEAKLQTPVRAGDTPGATPKSILKHRRMIDSNIQVTSKFAHTPGWMDRAKRTVNIKARTPASPSKRNKKKSGLARMLPSSTRIDIFESWFRYAHSEYYRTRGDPLKTVSFTSEKVSDPKILLTESGNTRDGIPTDTAETQTPVVTQGRRTMIDDSPARDTSGDTEWNTAPTPTSLSKVRGSPEPWTVSDRKAYSERDQQQMGYDWIAALLDSSHTELTDRTETYFRDIREFRRINKDECLNETVLHESRHDMNAGDFTSAKPSSSEPTSPNHTCIHSYTVTDRLFAVPVNSDHHGNSRCTVCCKKKTAPTSQSPAFVRVSIPRSTLSSPYKVKPHRRKSFDPSDSSALSRHCMAGFKQPQSARFPLGRNVDLMNETNRLKSKFTMTMQEAKQLAKRLKNVPPDTRDIRQTTLYHREARKITDQLLDMTHAMQYQSQLRTKTLRK